MSAVKTLIIINIITSLSLLIGFANNVAIANFFGLTRLLDAYFAAFVLPSLFMWLFVNYLGRNFLPILAQVRQQGLDEASRLTSSVINIVLIVAILVTALLAAFAPQIFSLMLPGFSAEEIDNATVMFWIMSPAIIFMAVTTFNEYVWRCREKYVVVVLCKMVLPIAILCAILVGREVLGEYSLPIGFLIGHILIFVLLAIGSGYRYRFTINLEREEIRRVFVNSGILMASGIIARSRTLIERYYGSILEPGAISAISLATKLCEPLYERQFIGVKMMAFTKAAKLFANGKPHEVGELYNITISAVLLFVVPMAAWVGLNADEIVGVLFMRGKFDEEMHSLVTLALLGLVPSIVFFSVNPILSNGFYVLDKISVPAFVMPVGVGIYFACIVVLSPKYGVLGLAIATTILASFIFCAMTIMLGRTLERFSSKQVFLRVLIYTTASVFAFWLAVSLAQSTTSSDILRLLMSFIAGIAMYTGLLALIRDPGFLYVKDKILQRKGR